jgi:BON domain
MDRYEDRLPLPSEDEGNLVAEPAEGMTTDSLVATEEGVPWDPPTDRVLDTNPGEGGADAAGTPRHDAERLEADDSIQAGNEAMPRDDALRADVVEALRASDVVAGDRIRVAVTGSQVILSGQVESIDVSDEILALAGDVPGVTDVVDELEVAGL